MPQYDSGSPLNAGLLLLVSLFAIFLGVVWAVLPFAIFGIKTRLDLILRTLELMALKLGAQEEELPRSVGLMPPTYTKPRRRPVPGEVPELPSADLNDAQRRESP